MNNSNQIAGFISSFDFKSFIEKYKDMEPRRLTFELKKKYGPYYIILAEQLKLHKKSLQKLPIFAENNCLFTSKSFEQSSSEALAIFKSKRFKGKTLLDLTGGLGIDDWAFSKAFDKIVSIDIDRELNEMARYNFKRLGINNVSRLDKDAYEFIHENNKENNKENNEYDIIYIDSDRRIKGNSRKSVLLEDTEPSIIKMKERLFELSDTIILKLSPLVDLTYITRKLENISIIYAVSLDNEIKEVLAVLVNNVTGGNPVIKAIDISSGNKEMEYAGRLKDETVNEIYDIHSGYNYFYEPALSLIKSGLAKKYAAENNLGIIANNCMYFLGNGLINGFFGRNFKIISQTMFSKSAVKKYLTENNIKKANIAKRNFPVGADELKKLFGLKDGGEDYLFFAQNSKKQKLFFHCRK